MKGMRAGGRDLEAGGWWLALGRASGVWACGEGPAARTSTNNERARHGRGGLRLRLGCVSGQFMLGDAGPRRGLALRLSIWLVAVARARMRRHESRLWGEHSRLGLTTGVWRSAPDGLRMVQAARHPYFMACAHQTTFCLLQQRFITSALLVISDGNTKGISCGSARRLAPKKTHLPSKVQVHVRWLYTYSTGDAAAESASCFQLRTLPLPQRGRASAQPRPRFLSLPASAGDETPSGDDALSATTSVEKPSRNHSPSFPLAPREILKD